METKQKIQRKNSAIIEADAVATAKQEHDPMCIPTGILSRKNSGIIIPESEDSGIGADLVRNLNLGRMVESKSKKSSLGSGSFSRGSRARYGIPFSLSGPQLPFDDTIDFGSMNVSPHVREIYASDQQEPEWDENNLKTNSTLPINIKFLDVKYKVSMKSGTRPDEKYILHGVTGSVQPGEVLALMGPSGGGKTTLLNLLSGRFKNTDPSGTITYNDQLYSKSLKRRLLNDVSQINDEVGALDRIGFVLQDDVAFPHLTVRETLTYSALLRLPNTLTKQQKEDRAMNVIRDLGLERCQNTIIGGAFIRGISGGERKRVCIGNEILLNPSLLFLDEPTSGLDSTNALRIVRMLHNIAKAGKTIVTTIHQPSSRLFNAFDKLVLLGRGSSLYFGKASEAMLYFSSIGCSPLIAMNPAEFLIDLANGNIKDKSFPSELEDKVSTVSQTLNDQKVVLSPEDIHEYLVDAFETKVATVEKKKLQEQADADCDGWSGCMINSRVWEASWWDQFSVLFRRGFKERRHEYLSWLKVTQVFVSALILGLLWWKSDASTPQNLQDQAGLLFFISVFWGFFPVFTAIFSFPQERAMLAKERSVDTYRLSAYFMARNLSDLPLDLLMPVVFLLVVYFMVGLKPTVSAFSLTLVTVFLSILTGQGLGLAIGAAFMDVKKATTLASITIMAFMLSGGFFIQEIPTFIVWIRYISFNYHSYRLLLKIQYSCSGTTTSATSCNYSFIRRLDLDNGHIEAAAMVAMIIGYRLLAYIFLRNMKLTASY